MRSTLIWPLMVALLLGCITVSQRPQEKDPKTPARIESKTPPRLEPTSAAGVEKAIVGDVLDVYRIANGEGDERWYRWWTNDWFVAFTWDGAWFPVEPTELPSVLHQFEPSPGELEERTASREEELRQLEQQMEELERKERGGKSRADELRELEDQMREIERKEAEERARQGLPPKPSSNTSSDDEDEDEDDDDEGGEDDDEDDKEDDDE